MTDVTYRTLPHDWIPSKVGHGAFQCRWCHCTDREAAFALGQACPKRVKAVPKFTVIEGGKK